MPKELQVTCIELSYSSAKEYTSIEKIGWSNISVLEKGKSTPAEMYDMIKSGDVVAFIPDYNHGRIILEAVERNGKKFVKARPDGELQDNLLRLEPCP